MKQVIIEKKIELDQSFERIEQLSCKKQANTVATSEGLQCTGTIEITKMNQNRRDEKKAYEICENKLDGVITIAMTAE